MNKPRYWFCACCKSRNLCCKPIACGICGQRREDAPPVPPKAATPVNAEWDALADSGFVL